MITIAKLLRVLEVCPNLKNGRIAGEGNILYIHAVSQLALEEHNYLLTHGFVQRSWKTGNYLYKPKKSYKKRKRQAAT